MGRSQLATVALCLQSRRCLTASPAVQNETEQAVVAIGEITAATSASGIADTIGGVAQAADSTATGATQTQSTAQELARMAAELQTTIATYKV